MTYVHPTRPHGAVKTVPPPHAAADPHDPPERNPKPWVVRVPVDLLDHRKNGGLGHRKLALLLVLETYARAKAYCWPGDAELAAALGCGRSVLHDLLAAVEADGWFRRIRPPKGQPGRLGFVMLRRLDPDRPAADPDSLAEVVALLARAIAGTGRAQETAPAAPGKSNTNRARKTGRRMKTLDPRKDEPTLTFAGAGGGGPGPDPEAVRPAAPPPIAAPCGPLTPPTPPEAPPLQPPRIEGATGPPGVPATPAEGASDPPPTREQLEAEIAELEARIAARAPRPPEAMDRIRLKNLRDLRDGTWKADPLAAASPSVTPRLDSWPTPVGPPWSSPVVETVDLIRRLASPGSGPDAVEAAALRVAARLGDEHSLGYYRRAFARVRSGELPLVRALSAWKAASGGTARVPGSVFTALLKGAD